ncbi:MAG: regulatory protein RecX [Bacteroidota bacterium]
MERYCAYQERCHKEVRQKLRDMGMIPDAADHVIHHLLQHNFLNETRFAQAFARGKFRTKKWGKNRIIRELKMRDISEFNLKLALKEIPEEDYFHTFHELMEKRIAQVDSEKNIHKKKKKIADYLLYRGWEPHLIWEKLREIMS